MRRALADAGFEVGLAPGFANKPEMTVARFAPRHTPQRPAGREKRFRNTVSVSAAFTMADFQLS